MSTLPKIEKSVDYDRFDLHPMNRLVSDGHGGWVLRKDLVASMKRHGFKPDQAITCERQPGNRLKIIAGHNRYVTARALGLAVYYLAFPAGTFAEEAPGDAERTAKPWTMRDYVRRFTHAGLPDYAELEEYCRHTGISHMIASSLLMGNAGESGNAVEKIKAGTWRVTDREYAWQVASLVSDLSRVGSWARSRGCVSACSKVLRVGEFDLKRFRQKINKHPYLFTQQRSSDDYLRSWEEAYNHAARGARFPLFTVVSETMKQRSVAKTTANQETLQ